MVATLDFGNLTTLYPGSSVVIEKLFPDAKVPEDIIKHVIIGYFTCDGT